MTSRKDVLAEVAANIEKNGILPLSLNGRRHALKRHEKARMAYEEARKELLTYEQSMFYRVAIFGSARLKDDSPEFEFVSDLTKSLVEARQVDIVTGGGPGIMEAANYGARRAIEEAGIKGRRLKSRNLGESIILPHEQAANLHLDFQRHHPEFSTRLQAFLDRTQAAYNAPGGIGTLFEMLLIAQAQQVGHLEKNYPVIAHPFWRPVVESWNDAMYHSRTAKGLKPLTSEADLKLITFSDSIPEIVEIVSKDYDRWNKNIRGKVRLFS